MSQESQVEFMRNRKQRHRSSRSKKGFGGRLAAELKEWLLTAVVVFAVMSVLNIFVFNISTVKGQSMQPTLVEGERLFINKLSLMFVNPKHGDVVILHDPSTGPSRKDFLVKRVIGIPGDIIEVKDHQLYVNGKIVNEPYIDTEIEDPDFAALTVESGNYFVMGDNRHASASKDSRYFGSIPQDMIVGRADYIWWPLSKLKGL
ncbi:signal peptidase I [Paenibacillus sp. PastF-3]|uniref:signal peptidase I n=1 Tax=Paenibacillus TaxID=44249 RepID=UPI00211AD123|nr:MULTISPECIES: signal peptidase I [unclassified Paenibacillus]MDH6373365.1 signal peptidase I [Paenibacillus sp. PastF-3]